MALLTNGASAFAKASADWESRPGEAFGVDGSRTAKSCGPDTPTLVSSSRNVIFAGDGGKRARSPGRARRKPLKPLRGECRVFSGVTVVTNACAFYQYARGYGRAERPAFPALLLG